MKPSTNEILRVDAGSLSDLEMAEKYRYLRIGQLIEWGGVLRERIDIRRYRKPFSAYTEQPELFDEEVCNTSDDN